MASYNKAIIVGNVGKEPEVKYTVGGKAVATISVATNARWNDGKGEVKERTDWHRVVVWGKLADTCGKHLKKGDRALFEGRLQTRKWTNQEGKEQYTTEIVASQVHFLGGGKARGDEPEEIAEGGPGEAEAPGPDGDIPF